MIKLISKNSLTFLGKQYNCSTGKAGISDRKKEGDFSTPSGTFPLRWVFYRPDRLNRPKTALHVKRLSKNHGWCDDSKHKDYNKAILIPHDSSHEQLWRTDHIYDIIVVLGYNFEPIISGKGSAIFLHLATPTYSPTRGCIAIKLKDMLEILKDCTAKTSISV